MGIEGIVKGLQRTAHSFEPADQTAINQAVTLGCNRAKGNGLRCPVLFAVARHERVTGDNDCWLIPFH